jgi:hypothetical protein
MIKVRCILPLSGPKRADRHDHGGPGRSTDKIPFEGAARFGQQFVGENKNVGQSRDYQIRFGHYVRHRKALCACHAPQAEPRGFALSFIDMIQ